MPMLDFEHWKYTVNVWGNRWYANDGLLTAVRRLRSDADLPSSLPYCNMSKRASINSFSEIQIFGFCSLLS